MEEKANLIEAANARIDKALLFAAEKHIGQVRKNTGVPYIVHPLEVLKQVSLWKVSKVKYLDVWITAILHDTIEDTNTTTEEIKSIFGEKVANWVNILTFRSKKDDETSHAYQADKSRHLEIFTTSPAEAIIVKAADRFCNVSDFMFNDIEYAKKYYHKAHELMDAIIINRGLIENTFGVPTFDAIDSTFIKLDKTLGVKVYT